MSNNAGWFPDPGGQPGMYRWWTGTAWSASVTANPASTPPPSAGPQGTLGAASTATTSQDPYQQSGSRRATGWWIGGGIALVAAVVAIVLLIQSLGGSIPGIPNIAGDPPTSSPNNCPPAARSTASPPATEPGWISSGNLAFPALDAPWETSIENRVPWGANSSMQSITDQVAYDGSQEHNWMASILVSDLFVGDGFASPKAAAETIHTCVLGIFYSDTTLDQKQIKSEQHNVGTHPGWLIETQLSFDIPGLKAKGERVILLTVQTGDDDYGLFYASIPDTRKNLLPDARKAMSGLKVVK